jgi:Kef-type K+ transport system membrane component KefB
MDSILLVGVIIFCGFIFGELAKKVKLPKVTGYILAGVFLNPGLFHIIPENFVEHTQVVTNIALSVITFSVGGTLLYSKIKKLGKSVLYITVFEGEFAFFAIILGFLLISPYFVHIPNAGWFTVFIPMSILLGSLGAPTDPSATLAVKEEYNAEGRVTQTVMSVAAFDDVLGIMNYSIAIAIAQVFISHQALNTCNSFLQPLLVILGAIVLGAVLGFLLNFVTNFIKRETEGVYVVIIIALLCVGFGLATILKVDQLLAVMTMGAIVVNFNKKQELIFKVLERYTDELIFVLFFTLSGMYLDFTVLKTALALILFFVIFRTIGKVSGTVVGALASKAPENVKKYTAGGLIPQGGIVVGLALIMKQNPAFDTFSDIIISVVIGATIFHEIIGPITAKISLSKAGEIPAKGEG